MSQAFDFGPLVPAGSPPPAGRWTGLAKYNFTGGNNDADEVPVDDLIAAATASLKREGRNLATYGLASGPQGYRPLREFLVQKLKRDAGITCAADEILVTSGSLQALDLVNGVLLTRDDTVIIEQDCYQGSINRLTRRGVLDECGLGGGCHGKMLLSSAAGVRPERCLAGCGESRSTRTEKHLRAARIRLSL